MKKIISILLVIGVIISLNSQVFAISYTNQFYEYYYAGQVATARSPFHLNNNDLGGDNFSLPDHRVNGPNNQPRYINYVSDLHNGTDFRASDIDYVYPMFKAKVIAVVQPGTVNNGYVIVQYDIDNNGTYDNYYVEYLHILPQAGLTVGTILRTDQKIGKIDILRGNGWPPQCR